SVNLDTRVLDVSPSLVCSVWQFLSRDSRRTGTNVLKVSRHWLGALSVLSVLVLARCGGTPDVPSSGGLPDGAGAPSSGGDPATSTSGSFSLNTGGSTATGSAGCSDTGCGEAGDPSMGLDVCGDGIVGKTEECDD